MSVPPNLNQFVIPGFNQIVPPNPNQIDSFMEKKYRIEKYSIIRPIDEKEDFKNISHTQRQFLKAIIEDSQREIQKMLSSNYKVKNVFTTKLITNLFITIIFQKCDAKTIEFVFDKIRSIYVHIEYSSYICCWHESVCIDLTSKRISSLGFLKDKKHLHFFNFSLDMRILKNSLKKIKLFINSFPRSFQFLGLGKSLHIAAGQMNSLPIIKFLCEKAMAFNHRDYIKSKDTDYVYPDVQGFRAQGLTALHKVVLLDDKLSAEYLIEKCPELLSIKDSQNRVPFAFAKNIEMKTIIANAFGVHMQLEKDRLFFEKCIVEKDISQVEQMLKSRGMLLFGKEGEAKNALLTAIKKANLAIFKLILLEVESLNIFSSDKKNMILSLCYKIAIVEGNDKVVKYLQERNVNRSLIEKSLLITNSFETLSMPLNGAEEDLVYTGFFNAVLNKDKILLKEILLSHGRALFNNIEDLARGFLFAADEGDIEICEIMRLTIQSLNIFSAEEMEESFLICDQEIAFLNDVKLKNYFSSKRNCESRVNPSEMQYKQKINLPEIEVQKTKIRKITHSKKKNNKQKRPKKTKQNDEKLEENVTTIQSIVENNPFIFPISQMEKEIPILKFEDKIIPLSEMALPEKIELTETQKELRIEKKVRRTLSIRRPSQIFQTHENARGNDLSFLPNQSLEEGVSLPVEKQKVKETVPLRRTYSSSTITVPPPKALHRTYSVRQFDQKEAVDKKPSFFERIKPRAIKALKESTSHPKVEFEFSKVNEEASETKSLERLKSHCDSVSESEISLSSKNYGAFKKALLGSTCRSEVKFDERTIGKTLKELKEQKIITCRKSKTRNTVCATKVNDPNIHLTIHMHTKPGRGLAWYLADDFTVGFIKFVEECSPELAAYIQSNFQH